MRSQAGLGVTGEDRVVVVPGEEMRAAGVLALVEERLGSVEGRRVLDLGARTGQPAKPFAAAGAHVVCIEGRQENIDLGTWDGVDVILDDVRNLRADRYGTFDVTLCLGLLYHLGATDAVELLRNMRAVTTGLAVVDTHVGTPDYSTVVNGLTVLGSRYAEAPSLMSSIGNDSSFWFTLASLEQAARTAGWDVEHHPGIRWPGEAQGRAWLVLT